MSRPRVPVVAPRPFFTPGGTSFSVSYRTLFTAEQGVGVGVICYGQSQNIELPGRRFIRIPDMPWFAPIRIAPSFATFGV